MDWTEILTQVIVIVLLPALGVLLTLVLREAFEVLKRQKYIKDSELLQGRLDAVYQLLASDVRKAWEEFSRGIKEDAADGKITKEEAKRRLQEVGKKVAEEFKEDWPEYVDALGFGKIKALIEEVYQQVKGDVVGE